MISESNVRKRIIAAAVGIVYAIVYGFWTLLGTGGGHGNFIWLMLVIFPGLLGIYYPLMAVLAVDLRPFAAKVVFGSLLGLNTITSIMLIAGWIGGSESEGRSDFEKTVNAIGFGGIVFSAVFHFVPTLFFLIILLRAATGGGSVAEDDYELTGIHLS
jgi:hypothetical protein